MRACTNLSKILVIMMTMVSAPLPNYIENMVTVDHMLSSFLLVQTSVSTLSTFLLNQTGYCLSEAFYLATLLLYPLLSDSSFIPSSISLLVQDFYILRIYH